MTGNTEQLAEVTPWSLDAIEKMVRRGILQQSVHFFQPFGHRSQRVFKWAAIVELIEGKSTSAAGVLRRSRPATAGNGSTDRGDADHREDGQHVDVHDEDHDVDGHEVVDAHINGNHDRDPRVVQRRGQLDVQQATSELRRVLGR